MTKLMKSLRLLAEEVYRLFTAFIPVPPKTSWAHARSNSSRKPRKSR